MTPSPSPPPSSSLLSKEEIRTMADVRRSIWTDAFWGMGIGALTGISLHTMVATFVSYRNKNNNNNKNNNINTINMITKKLTFNRSTAMAWFLAGGAFGSFLMATTTGKNEVHKLHSIFQAGSSQQHQQRQAQEQQEFEEQQRKMRQDNRIMRRKTLQDTFQRQHGLSDSHGGKWADNNNHNNNHDNNNE